MLTDEFVTRVRQMCQLPDSDQDWGDSEILQEATHALRERFTQVIANSRQGYWLKDHKVLLQAGRSQYRIPYRSTVQGLELVEIACDDGPNRWRQLQIATPSQTTMYAGNSQSEPSHFEIRGDNIVLYPTPQTPRWVRMRGYLRPSELIPVIASNPDGPGDLWGYIASCTFLNEPPDPPFLQVELIEGSDFDFTEAVNQSFDIVQTTGCCEVTIPNVYLYTYLEDPPTLFFRYDFPGQFDAAGTVMTSSEETPERAAMVFPADYTWHIPLPSELCTALVAWVSAVILTERGDLEKAAACSKKAEAAITRAIDVMTPRIKAQPYTFKTRNTYLRRRQAWGWGRW